MAEIEFKRVNIRLPAEVKEWYEKKAEQSCMPMASAMSIVLLEHYNQQQNALAIRKMADMQNSEEVKEQLDELKSILAKMPKID